MSHVISFKSFTYYANPKAKAKYYQKESTPNAIKIVKVKAILYPQAHPSRLLNLYTHWFTI